MMNGEFDVKEKTLSATEITQLRELTFEWAQCCDMKDWKRLAEIIGETITVTYSGENGCVPVFDEPVDMNAKTYVALASWPGFLSDRAVESQHFIGASKFRKVLPVFSSSNGAATTPPANGANGHANGGHLDSGSTYGYVPNGNANGHGHGHAHSGNSNGSTHRVVGWHQARLAWTRQTGCGTPAIFATEHATIRLTYVRKGNFWDVLTQNQAGSTWKITGVDIQTRWCEGPTKKIFRFDENGSFAEYFDSEYSGDSSDASSEYAATTHSTGAVKRKNRH